MFNPATGEQSGEVASGGAAEIEAAVAAAQAALPGWAATTPARRARVMFEMRRLLEARKEELARIIGAEHGKTHADALGEVARGQEVVEFACGIPQLLKGASAPRRQTASIAMTCASRWAWWRASRRSIFPSWCRCG